MLISCRISCQSVLFFRVNHYANQYFFCILVFYVLLLVVRVFCSFNTKKTYEHLPKNKDITFISIISESQH